MTVGPHHIFLVLVIKHFDVISEYAQHDVIEINSHVFQIINHSLLQHTVPY